MAAVVTSGQAPQKGGETPRRRGLPRLPGPDKIPGPVSFFSKACLLLFLLVFSPPGRTAALGDLIVTSAPGQPLAMEIDLAAVKEKEASSLAARVILPEPPGGPDSRSSAATFKTAVKQREDGRFHVQITSSEPAAERYSTLLVELGWSSGRVAREYRLPVAASGHSKDAPAARGVPIDQVRTFPEPLPSTGTLQAGTMPGAKNSASPAGSISGMTMGKIRRESEAGSSGRNPMDLPGTERTGGPIRLAPPPDGVKALRTNPIADLAEPGLVERMFDKARANAAYVGTAFLLLVSMIGVGLSLSQRFRKLFKGVGREVLGDLLKFPASSRRAASVERPEERGGRQGSRGVAAPVAAPRVLAEGWSATGNREAVSRPGNGNHADPADAGTVDAPVGEASGRPSKALPERGEAAMDPDAGDRLPASAGEAPSGRYRREVDGTPHWWVMPSGIDLAWAYQEKGDIPAAIRVLEKVLADGDARQQDRARSMLARLQGAGPR